MAVNDNVIEMFYRNKEECDVTQSNTNIFIAVFTTTYARLKLYSALDLLQEQILYFDTGKQKICYEI